MSFAYYEDSVEHVDLEKIARIITDGHSEGRVLYIIRNAVEQTLCEKIRQNFYAIMQTKGNHRPDDEFVKIEQIGSSQFHKTGQEYMRATQSSGEDVLSLYDGLSDLQVRNLYLDCELEALFRQRGILYRPSCFKSHSANFATTRRWLDNGDMSLWPHDDSAQLKFAAKDNYEIAQAENVISSNLCVCDAQNGGELKVWDCRPDDHIRREFDVLDTGYPYPLEFAERFTSYSVRLAPGDLYFLNASYLHGVTSSVENERISSGRFIGFIDNKVVYWT